MKFLDKLGLALFSIIVLVISVVLCLIGFGWMEPTIFGILISKVLINQTYTYIMIGVSIVLVLLAIRCIFFADSDDSEESDDGILLQNEDGRLLITVETLKDMVAGVVKDIPNITNSVANVVITKDNEIIIEAIIDVTKETAIKEVSSKLQTRVKKAVKDATDLDIKYVNVRVRNADNVTQKVVKEEKKVEEANKEEHRAETIKKEEHKVEASKSGANYKKEAVKSKPQAKKQGK